MTEVLRRGFDVFKPQVTPEIIYCGKIDFVTVEKADQFEQAASEVFGVSVVYLQQELNKETRQKKWDMVSRAVWEQHLEVDMGYTQMWYEDKDTFTKFWNVIDRLVKEAQPQIREENVKKFGVLRGGDAAGSRNDEWRVL